MSLVARITAQDLSSLGPCRSLAWEISTPVDGVHFLRMAEIDGNHERLLHLPCLERFTLSGQLLTPLGKSLPTRELPNLQWLPIASLLPIVPLPPQDDEPFFGHVDFQLIPHNSNHPASALLLSFAQLTAWTETAAAPRLKKLTYALSSNNQALVLGTPLPPLPGQSFYERDRNLFLPIGLGLPGHIRPGFLTQGTNTITLIDRESHAHVIAAEFLVPLTRRPSASMAL